MNYFIIFLLACFLLLLLHSVLYSKDEQLTSATSSLSSIDFQITMDGDERTHAHYGAQTHTPTDEIAISRPE